MIRHDKISQDVLKFLGIWVLNLELSLRLSFYQTWEIKCDKVSKDVIICGKI